MRATDHGGGITRAEAQRILLASVRSLPKADPRRRAVTRAVMLARLRPGRTYHTKRDERGRYHA